MKKIELEIIALSHSVAQSQSYAVILGEINSSRRLPIIIGIVEAQSIAMAIDNQPPQRPLTHDLTHNICKAFGINLREVVISKLQEGIFHATLVCELAGEFIEIDSRSSDALALAVRFNCPIYTYEPILDQAGITINDVPNEKREKEKLPPTQKESFDITGRSSDELYNLLQEAISNEDYEKAARLRDEINKRK
ncbi:MAG: bifunctional nuclease family protein [Sphingobacteriales bacterium]|nr:MAG: bifunctional nuclease family protein [Sphingobacteriales bacterium]